MVAGSSLLARGARAWVVGNLRGVQQQLGSAWHACDGANRPNLLPGQKQQQQQQKQPGCLQSPYRQQWHGLHHHQQHQQQQQRGFAAGRGPPLDPPPLPPVADVIEAAQSMEPVQHLGHMLDPVVLATSYWEWFHSLAGLPWWVSIPLATVVTRSLFLPLTLKARAATANFILMQHASTTAGNLLSQIKEQQQSIDPDKRPRLPTRWQLSRTYYKYMRKQHHTTSIWWYHLNVFMQVNVFLSLSVSLRQMSGTLWPGLPSEGILWFKDLTLPALELSPLACPLGVSGLLVPLGLFWLFLQSVEASPIVRRPLLKAGVDALALPYFMAGLLVPHATLLYWASNTGFQYSLQRALAQPRVAAALKLKSPLTEAQSAQEASALNQTEMEYLAKLVDARDDVGFIEFLADQNMRQGRHRKAKQYYKRLVKLRPGDPAALAKLGEAQAMLGLFARAMASHTKAADIYKTDGNTEGQGHQLIHAGAAGINVAMLGPVTRKGNEEQKAQDEVVGAGDDVGDVGADGVQEEDTPALRKRYLQSARAALLHATKVIPSDASAWHYLATAQLVSRDRQATWDAIKQCWKVCKATQDSGTRAVTASRLSALLIKLCERLLRDTEPQQINWLQLYEALEMAAEVSLQAEEIRSQLDLHQLLELAQQKAVEEPLMLEQLRALQRSMPKTSPQAMRHFERVASGR